MIPYGRQSIDDDDIQAVIEALRSNWLTTGPKVELFEQAVADYVDAKYAVAVSSGTAGLHCAMFAIDIRPGDEVIVPPMTFAATANCVVYQGGIPVFADVDPDTLTVDPVEIEKKITPKTKAMIAVDFAGQPCDYDWLIPLCHQYGIVLVADSCHALGAEYKDQKVGSIADLTVFSFHPVKHITTGEGGMVTTNIKAYQDRMKAFRNHGISTSARHREIKGTWYYEMLNLGYNYRVTDIQCALGISQLKKLPGFLDRRRKIARMYDFALQKMKYITPLKLKPHMKHSYHLYVVKVDKSIDRNAVFRHLRSEGIGVNVHYIPVYYHPFYKANYRTSEGLCPNAEMSFNHILSLPIFPTMTESEINKVIAVLKDFD